MCPSCKHSSHPLQEPDSERDDDGISATCNEFELLQLRFIKLRLGLRVNDMDGRLK